MILSCQSTFAQIQNIADSTFLHSTAEKIETLKFSLIDISNKIDSLANVDIKNKKMLLFLAGGVAPIMYTTDKNFEKKYQVYFYDFGDISPDHKYLIRYNNIIFDHLKELYDKTWMNEIRKDVLGFKNWKKGRK